jgi:hypothetical protein
MNNTGSCLEVCTVVAIILLFLLLAYFVGICQFGVHMAGILL